MCIFENAREAINHNHTINDIEVKEALSALDIVIEKFGNKNLNAIPDRINICTKSGNVIFAILNDKGLPESYNCIPRSSWFDIICEHKFITGLVLSGILIPVLIYKYKSTD